MAYTFPEGSKFLFSSTFGSAVTAATMSNASPTVVGAASHGFIDGDELLLTSGWEDASDSVFKADQLTTDTLTLLGLDTTNTSFYAPGGGANSTLKKVTAWTEIPQVLTIGTQGGDPRFTQIAPLARRNAFSVPVGFNPTTITLTLGHDASSPAFQAMLAVSRTLSKVAFKMVLSGGATSYGFGYLVVSEIPQLSSGQANQVQAAFNLLGRAISYQS